MTRILLSGLIFAVIGSLIHIIEPVLTIQYYMMPQYFPVWSKLMMPNAGPPPTEFYILSFLSAIVSGVILAWFYNWVKKLLPKDFWRRVGSFTGLVLLLDILFWALPTVLLINLPAAVIFSWTVSTVLATLLGTMVFVKVLK